MRPLPATGWWKMSSSASRLYVTLPSSSESTGHASGWFFQYPCVNAHSSPPPPPPSVAVARSTSPVEDPVPQLTNKIASSTAYNIFLAKSIIYNLQIVLAGLLPAACPAEVRADRSFTLSATPPRRALGPQCRGSARRSPS